MKAVYNYFKNNLNNYEDILAFEELINSLDTNQKEYLVH